LLNLNDLPGATFQENKMPPVKSGYVHNLSGSFKREVRIGAPFKCGVNKTQILGSAEPQAILFVKTGKKRIFAILKNDLSG
jgi:hypothetical protein